MAAKKPTAGKKPIAAKPTASQDAYTSGLGRYFGGVDSAPTAPKASPTPSAPIDGASGFVIGSREYEKFIDARDMALSQRAAGLPATINNPTGRNTPPSPKEDFAPPLAPPPPPAVGTSSTGRQIAESILRSRGIPEKIINSSLDFINELSLELGDDIETPITILLNSPEYTTKAGKKLASPYYNMYGKFAKYADAETSDPRVLPGLIDDFRALAKAYNLPEDFSSDATIETAFKNKVDYATLDKRYAAAQAKAIIADPFFVESAKQQGFINNTKDLTAFYADPAMGKTQMERNKIQNLLGAETLRAGMKINTATLAKTATELESRGYDEATAAAKAAKDMSTVAEQLQPITTYSGVYEGKLAGTTEQIQQELVNEQMLGQASTRRKRLEEMNKAAYQGRSGTTNVSLNKSIQL
jgi:hypothetical protein